MTSTKGATNMKKRCSRLLAVLCAVCLTVSITVPAFAEDAVDNTDSVLNTESVSVIGPIIYPVAFGEDETSALEAFHAMTVDELDAYIGDIANGVQPSSTYSTNSLSTSFLVWLAAAVVFHKLGLECTYTLLLYSLAGDDYTEIDGLFSEKIKESIAFLAWYPLQPSSDIEFNALDYDLMLSLHGADIYCTNPTRGLFNIIDTYDFDRDGEFGNEVINTFNYGAWLLTQVGVLHEISFEASFTYTP